MAIRFTCSCGLTLEAEDEYAGQATVCPQCGTQKRIPLPQKPPMAKLISKIPAPAATPSAADPGFEVVDDDEPVVAAPAKKLRNSDVSLDENKLVRRKQRTEDEEEVRPRKRRIVDDEEFDRPRKQRRRQQLESQDSSGWFGTEKWVLSGGAIGGGIAMLVAVVWFILGLMADRIFFYPPILFLVGLGGILKAFVTGGARER
jgi:hypothetical protein